MLFLRPTLSLSLYRRHYRPRNPQYDGLVAPRALFDEIAEETYTPEPTAEDAKRESDPKEALRWYRKAAEGGDKRAFFCLGNAYYQGRGAEQSMERAAKFYTVGARAGHVLAMVNLGNMLQEGLGVPGVDLVGARSLYERAAPHSEHAQILLDEITTKMAQEEEAAQN